MENDGQECLEFRSYLASLHHELLNTEIQGREGRIWFQDILKEPNPRDQISEPYNRAHYFLKVTLSRGLVSDVQVHVKKLSDNSSLFQYRNTEYDMVHLLSNPDLGRLSNNMQGQIRFFFDQLKPFSTKNVLATDLSNEDAYYKCDAYNFIRDLNNTNCYSISVCKSLIEILYQLRNVLFHGELVPNQESQRVYKSAYFCLKHLLESLR